MLKNTDSTAAPSTRLARITWLVSFVVPMLVIALLALVKPVQASTVPSPPSVQPASVSATEEADAETSEEDEWEGWDEDEEDEGEEDEEGFPAGECPLRSARASATATHGALKLTIDYTTYEPIDARVEILRGGVPIGSAWRHLWRSGVLRITKKLPKRPKSGRLLVRFRIPRTPPSCGRLQGKTIRIH